MIALMNAYTEGMSGGDLWFMEVAKRWHEVDLIIITSQLGKQMCLERGVNAIFEVTSTEDHFKGVALTYLLRTLRAIRFLWRYSQGDVVLSTSDAPPDVLPAFLFRIQRNGLFWVQRIYHIIAPKHGRMFSSLVQQCMLVLVKNKADKVFVDSESLRINLCRKGFKEERLFTTHPGVGFDEYNTLPLRNISIPKDRVNYDVITVGRLHKTKGIYELPEILSKVVKQLPDVRLGLIGQGDEPTIQRLKALLKLHGVTNSVDFLGFVSDDHLDALYRNAKLFISLSHEEGYGMVILEAMARHLPVLGWDLDIYEEHFGDCMLTVKEGDTDAFAEAVVKLLSDAELHNSIREKGYNLASGRTWDAVADQEWDFLTSWPTCRSPYQDKKVHNALRVRKAFANWPSILLRRAFTRYLSIELPITFISRGGAVIDTLAGDNSFRTLIEVIANDVYRLCDLAGMKVSTVVDLGANIGAFTLFCAERFPQARIISFEPNQRACAQLATNVNRNQLSSRVEIHHSAVTGSSLPRRVKLWEPVSRSVNSSLLGTVGGGRGEGRWVDVPAVSLTELLSYYHEVDLLKMDVEGAEYDIIAGMAASALRNVCRIVLEYHPIPEHDYTELVGLLERAGFRVTRHEGSSVEPDLGILWFERGKAESQRKVSRHE